MKGHFQGNPSFMPPTLVGSAEEIVSNLKDLKKFLLARQTGKNQSIVFKYFGGFLLCVPCS